jgi:hypothetical protein
LRWLNNVGGVYLTQVSLFLIGQQHLVDFCWYRPLFPIGWQIVQILRQRRGTTTNTAPTTHSAIQKQQAIPNLSIRYYTPLVISGKDKNKQLTSIKSTQTGVNRNK